ncbi:DNA repair protein RecO [Desulforhopalus sp. IMCC35007]|uniref:DNA repair protein RecO n=1 Tax=Desulforhopalus sp. IMCC35007 TaxID=2569543 RepID=UPI00145F9039|nr:DNA repair protein RecO [Desulforhopalus sp. IMCC35007]
MESGAIVLDTTDHGESDLIVTLFCQESGRVTAIAKGAKRSKKRFVNKLEFFTYLQVNYQQKNEQVLAFLSEAEIYTCFPSLRQNLNLYGIATIIREFLLLGVKDGEPDNNIFRLTLWAFHRLDNKEEPRQVLALFLIQFFGYLGYRPDFHSCGNCNQTVQTTKSYRFNSSSGQLICSSCNQNNRCGRPLSQGTIKIVQTAQDQPLDRLHRLKISGSILKESLQLLHNFGRHIFQREITSWHVLAENKKTSSEPSYLKNPEQ